MQITELAWKEMSKYPGRSGMFMEDVLKVRVIPDVFW